MMDGGRKRLLSAGSSILMFVFTVTTCTAQKDMIESSGLAITVMFSQSTYSVNEDDGLVQPVLVLSSPSSTDITVKVTNTDGSATGGGIDYDSEAYTITFPAEVICIPFNISINDDNILEDNENFTLIINTSSLPNDISVGDPGQATVTIRDNDSVTIKFKESSYRVNERNRNVQVQQVLVVLSNSSSTDITVNIQSNDITATGGVDYVSGPYTVTFPAGMTEVSFDVTIMSDRLLESDEMFQLSINSSSLPNRVTVDNPSEVTVTIMDDDPITVSFNQSTYSINEDDGSAQPVLVLSNPSSTDITVQVRDNNNTATGGGVDYNSGPYNVTFTAGVTSVTFGIPITEDKIHEESEIFNLIIDESSLPSDFTSSDPNNVTVTIINDDSITVSFTQSTYRVKEENVTLKPVLVLNDSSSVEITLNIKSTNVLAIGGSDYAKGPYTVIFSAGKTEGSFGVDIISDRILESNETFNLSIISNTLSNRVTVDNPSEVTVTIVDNDPITVSFSQSTYSVNENDGSIQPVLVLSNPSSTDITVQVRDNSNTATGEGVDYNSGLYNVIFIAGRTSVTFNILIVNDMIHEGDESFTLTILNPLRNRVSRGNPRMTTVTIADTTDIKVEFTQSQYIGSEATGFVMVTLKLVGGTSSNPFNVTVTPSEQSPVSAKGGVDFDTTTLTATFDSGMTMSSVSVPVIDDKLAEGGNETFDLILIVPSSLGPAITAGGRNRAKGVIIDTTMLVVEFESEQYTGSESSGFAEAVVIISGGSSTTPISATITMIERSARGSGVDFDSNPINITFADREVSKSVSVPVTCDKITSEGRERFDIWLTLISNNPHVRTGRDRSAVRIRDDTVTVSFRQSLEVLEDTGEVMIVMRLSPLPSEPFDVMISSMDITAIDGEDYRINSTTVSVPAGEMSKSFTINIVNDNMMECNETFKLTLSVPASTCGAVNGERDTTEVTIVDNAWLSFNQSQYSIEENITPLSVGLMLSGRAPKDVVVEVTITDGSAKAGIDYGNSSQSLVYNVTITAGMTSSSFDVDIIDNKIQDGDKMFTITIRLIPTCLPVTINSTTTTVTIIDDEVLRIQFASTIYSGLESAGEILVSIEIVGGIPGTTISVNIGFLERNATGDDFNTTPLIATIPAGATNTTVRVAVTNDNIVEGDEMFSMNLNVPSSLGPGVVAGSIANATGIIIDTSKIKARFAQTQYTGSEATGFVVVTLELVRGVSSSPFSVTVTPSEQSPVSAKGGIDFDTTTLTATFDSGMTMNSVRVPVIDDDIVEGNETFSIKMKVNIMSTVSRGITTGTRNHAVVIITDSTVTARITSDPISVIVLENTTATLSCEATGSGPIRYQWRRVNGEISSDRAEGVNTSTLTISPVQQEDEDEYYCVASNDLKDESKAAIIAVLSKTTGTSTDNHNFDSQTIGIAVLSVLLAVAAVCILGLVIYNVKLNKKLAKTKPKENHQNVPEQPKYELVPKVKPDYVNMESNHYIQDSSVEDHHYDVIPGNDDAKASS